MRPFQHRINTGYESPRIIEIVGPSGAGKTTLSVALSQQHGEIQRIYSLHRLQYVPQFAWSSLQLLPTYLQQYLWGTRYTRQEIVWMMRLNALHQIVKRLSLADGQVILLDQGPIYLLTRLYEAGEQRDSNQPARSWLPRKVQEWAITLDHVITLDTPVDILLERVHARAKWHVLKEKSVDEAQEMLREQRALYQQVVSQLAAYGHTRVFPSDTYQTPLADVVDEVLAELQLTPKTFSDLPI